jgi:opacity protein-like surface antigen
MKKTLSAAAVLAFIFTANTGFAGSPVMKTDGCPEDCQREIDTLQSSQARQDEQIKGQEDLLNQQAAEIAALKTTDDGYNPWYVKGVAKLTMFSNLGTDNIDRVYSIGFDTDSAGYGWGLALGRQFGQFRVEGQYDSNKTDLDDARVSNSITNTEIGIASGDIRVNTAMINGFYDFPITEGFSLYGMAGMGYGNVTLSVYNVDDNEKTFAYKLGAGVSYTFAGNQAVDFGYEYLGVGDVVIGGIDVNDMDTHNIVLGYRFSF